MKWTREEQTNGPENKKTNDYAKALHPRDDVNRRYVSRKEGGRGLTGIEDSVDASIQRRENYIEKRVGRLVTATRNNTDHMRSNRTEITRKQKWEGKQLYGRFKRLTSDISHKKTWTWLRKGNLKRENESLLKTVQNNAIRTNHIKAKLDKTQQNSRCWLCGNRDETINHIISECSKLAQKEYKTKHNWLGKGIHWELCKKLKFDHANKWYMHNPESVLENKTHKAFCNFEIQTDHLILARRPDLVIIYNKRKKRENSPNCGLRCPS